tara:strand:- start:39 stop:1211 length:1173 start_codon:yes stop_codon:yes gene_type:complete
MKQGHLKNLVEAKVEEHGGNLYQGANAAADVVGDLISEGKLNTKDISLRQVYEELVDCPINESAARVSEALNSSAFPNVAQKIIHSDIIDEYELAVGAAQNLITEAQASRTDEELVVGFTAGDTTPLLRRQGMAYEETSMGEKNWTIKMADFGRMISLTREVIFEDRTGEVLARARDIGRAAGHHKQKMIIESIEVAARSAFEESSSSAAIYKGSAQNAAAMYSNDHSSLDGQVNDNLIASNALVDFTDLDAVYQAFSAMVDEAGNKIDIVPNTILVPSALKAKAFQIMNSQMLGGGANDTVSPTYNPVNDLAQGGLNIASSVFLNSASDWYMGDFSKQLKWLNVYAPATESQGANSELAFTNQIVSRFRFSYHAGMGHTDWRYIVKCTA